MKNIFIIAEIGVTCNYDLSITEKLIKSAKDSGADRVSRDYIVLHEPIYETAPDEQKKRMEKFGYIQTLRRSIHESNGVEIIEECLFPEGLGNSVNRATLFILRKKDKVSSPQREESGIYACPLVGSKLIEQNGYWLSLDGLCYPEINGIPILREKYALPYYQQAKFLKT